MFWRVLYYFKHHVWRVLNLLEFKTFLMGKVQCKQFSRRKSCQPNLLFANRVVKNKVLKHFLTVMLPFRHLGRLEGIFLVHSVIMCDLWHELGEMETSRQIRASASAEGDEIPTWSLWMVGNLQGAGAFWRHSQSASWAPVLISNVAYGLESEK